METALRIWTEVPGLRDKRGALAERIDKMRAEIEALDAGVATLADGGPGEPDAALKRLASDLANDRQNERLRADRARNLSAAMAEEDHVGEALAEAEAALMSALKGLAGDLAGDPGALVERLSRREGLKSDVAGELDRLVEQGWTDERAVTAALRTGTRSSTVQPRCSGR